MSNLISAGLFLILTVTLVGVFIKNRDETSTATQAALIAAVISTLIISVDTLIVSGIPATIFILVESLLLAVMVAGVVYGYRVDQQSSDEEKASL